MAVFICLKDIASTILGVRKKACRCNKLQNQARGAVIARDKCAREKQKS